MTFTQIVRQFKFPISGVLLFVIIENGAWIIEPTFFGTLLDALIEHFTDKETQVDIYGPLILWVLIYLLNVFGGAMSRLYSGRVYARMYADIASRVVVSSKKRGYPVSGILARAELAHEYIIFFKERLPEISWQVFATGGGVIALFFYDWRIALVAFLVIFPVVWINNLYRKNVVTLQTQLHDTREDLFRLVEERETSKIHHFYHDMVAPQHQIAKWNAIDYGIIKVILMFVFIGVLFICVDVDNFSTGKIYAIVSYIWTFIASTEYLPGLMESLTSVKDLSSRLKEEEEDENLVNG